LNQETALPTVLFLPDVHYDHRIWADIPSSLSEHYDVLHYDTHEPVPWAAPETFVPALRRLIPEDGRTLIVAAGYAAGFAVHAALSGLAGGLVLFQPAPDYLPPDAFRDVPVADLFQAAAPYSGLVAAVREPDPARRSELAISTMQGIYRDGLSEADLALVSQVAGDHVDELVATMAQTITAVEAGDPAPQPGLPWVDQLADVTVPVSVITSRRAKPVGEAIAKRILAGRFAAADATTDLPWLEDRPGAISVLRQMLTKL
jgi:hypothetical protein